MRTGNRTCFRAAWLRCPAACLLILASCSVAKRAEWRGREQATEEFPIAWEASGTWSHLSRPVRIVAYDAATLAQVPVAEVPVDFSSQMVLIVSLGPTLGEDVGIRISRVWRDGHRLRVQERLIHPGLAQASRLERSSPWTIVVVPRSELMVEGYTSQVPSGLLGG